MRWFETGWTIVGLLFCGSAYAGTVSADGDGLPAVSAHSPWIFQERSEDPNNAWVLYRREVGGSKYTAFRLEAEIGASPTVVAAAAQRDLADPEITRKNTAKTILRNDADETIIYSYIELPLLSDRDVTTRTVWSRDPELEGHLMEWGVTEEGPAPKAGVVRLQKSSGSWAFLPHPRGTLTVYETHTEIEGAIPAWIVNRMMRETVVDGIVRLRARVAQDFEPTAVGSTDRSTRVP